MKKIIASLLCGLVFAACTGKQTEGNHQGNVDMGHGTHTIDYA